MLAYDRDFFVGLLILATMGFVVFDVYDPERLKGAHSRFCMSLNPNASAEDAQDFNESGCAELVKKARAASSALNPQK